MEFLSDGSDDNAAQDVLIFTREAMAKFANLRSVILEKLLESFSSIRSAKTHRAALWILGEYCTDSTDIQVRVQIMFLLCFVRTKIGPKTYPELINLISLISP